MVIPATKKQYIILSFLAIALLALMVVFLPPGIDWHNVYLPATKEFLAGRSPFSIYTYFNAPWILIPFIPLVFLPEPLSRAIVAFAILASFGYTAYRLGAKFPAIILILISPPVVHNVLNGNIDGLVLLGIILPPQIGLFFIAIKPQIGSAVALFWLIETWRSKGFKEVARVFAPVVVALSITFVAYGFWPRHFLELSSAEANASLWPLSIPIGLALITAGIRKRQIKFPIAASPFLSPYLKFHSWSTVLLALSGSLPELAAAVAGLWIVIAIRGFSY